MRQTTPRVGRDRGGRERTGRRRERQPAIPVYAAVDLGTNNCRMLAARPARGQLRIVDSFSRIVRLGEGASVSGILDDAAIERTIAALRICAGKIHRLGAKRVRNIATQACRAASNGTHFLDRVKADTGLEMECISADEEARLTVSGCVPLFDAERRFVLMFDIGGGSTEVTWIEQQGEGRLRILGTRSVAIGVMTIADQFGTGILPPRAVKEITNRVDAKLAELDQAHGISEHIAAGRVQMLGTSGTVTTLGGIHLNLRRYDRSKVDGIDLSISAIHKIADRLGGLSEPQRAAIPCVGTQRADLMIAGCTLLQTICNRWTVDRLTVADRGIREGILFEMMGTDGFMKDAGRIPSFELETILP
ncbi:MAG: Ppx/GppA family phosphatase [Rhodospirillales bacterium]|jgi:exopolyphosphatase / guanosine-5'-triphosphate,3'-diphosphate pyrophosphatase|nr:Ppx/GppA family phosphatase [Rhodospirillales bacterium]